MKTPVSTSAESALARSLAPEDVRCGQYVSVLDEIVESPAFIWSCAESDLKSGEMIRVRIKSNEGGIPLRVKSICLPFVAVQTPQLQTQLLDLRRVQLVRLSREYGKTVSKALGKPCSSTASQTR